jgi:hypothetical protein
MAADERSIIDYYCLSRASQSTMQLTVTLNNSASIDAYRFNDLSFLKSLTSRSWPSAR